MRWCEPGIARTAQLGINPVHSIARSDAKPQHRPARELRPCRPRWVRDLRKLGAVQFETEPIRRLSIHMKWSAGTVRRSKFDPEPAIKIERMRKIAGDNVDLVE